MFNQVIDNEEIYINKNEVMIEDRVYTRGDHFVYIDKRISLEITGKDELKIKFTRDRIFRKPDVKVTHYDLSKEVITHMSSFDPDNN